LIGVAGMRREAEGVGRVSPHSELGGAATAVTIYGRTYHLRGSEDEPYLRELAAVVDRKMREVAEGSATADTVKIAILAALNIADDYLQARRGGPVGGTDELDARLARMVTLLDEAIGSEVAGFAGSAEE
jgi:cell division protein ZapA